MVTCSMRCTEEGLLGATLAFSSGKRKRDSVYSPGDATPGDRGEGEPKCPSVGTKKRAKYSRHRKQSLELRSCDSGVADLYETPSPSPVAPSPTHEPWDTCTPMYDGLGLQNFRDYGQDCYTFNKSLEDKFLAVNCLKNQPQVETRPPRVKQLLALCCDAFSREQLCNLECIILLKLHFRLGAPTINFFLQHFSLLRVTNEESSDTELSETTKSVTVARGIAELSLADYAFNSYSPSLMAVCCLEIADRMLCHRNPIRARVSDYHESLIQECVGKIDLLVSLNQDSLHRLLPSQFAVKSINVDN
ncbi:cyclin-O protein B isoform X1 [Xenopus laevis]|uniref:Cyclin-O protein B isoform X1 n=1 Tax=Xenopus laevis TaxID=8355 RepID=A0A8J0U2C3_XENLA|nr:cyclin-O protein B isoform X1 [Xenopus laevis]